MASSAIEIRSPAVSSMSSSRPGGSGDTCWARSISSSVVSPIAETTTTTSLPALLGVDDPLRHPLDASASATEEPPYFCTTRPTRAPRSRLAGRGVYRRRADAPRSASGHRTPRGTEDSAARRLRRRIASAGGLGISSASTSGLSNSASSRSCETTECSARSTALASVAPGGDVGELPPPQRLADPARAVVPQPVQPGRSRSRSGRRRAATRSSGGSTYGVEDLGVGVDASSSSARRSRMASRSGSDRRRARTPRAEVLCTPSRPPASSTWLTSSSSREIAWPGPVAARDRPHRQQERLDLVGDLAGEVGHSVAGPRTPDVDPRLVTIDRPPSLEGPTEGDLVGVLEVSSYRQSTRQPRHAQPHRLDQPAEVGRRRLALEVGVGGQDHLGDRRRRPAGSSARGCAGRRARCPRSG